MLIYLYSCIDLQVYTNASYLLLALLLLMSETLNTFMPNVAFSIIILNYKQSITGYCLQRRNIACNLAT